MTSATHNWIIIIFKNWIKQNQVGNDFAQIVERYDGPAFGFASRNYYAQFLAAREIAVNPDRYFSEGIRYETPMAPGQYLAVD